MTGILGRRGLSRKWAAALLLLILIIGVAIFRRPIAINGIEYFTKEQNLSVSCLNFSFDWSFNLKIQKACVTSLMGKLEVRNAKWQIWSNVLTIDKVTIEHLESVDNERKIHEIESKQKNTDELALPESLPLLSISTLDIDSFMLLQPLHLTIKPVSHKQLNITGDLNAEVKLSPSNLAGELTWRLSDLTKFIPQAQQLFEANSKWFYGASLENEAITSEFTYNGKNLSVNNTIDLASDMQVRNCSIAAVAKGNIRVDVNLVNLEINTDLSQLTNQLSAIHCPLLNDYFAVNDLPLLSLRLPQVIVINETHITLPELQLVDKQNLNRSIVVNELDYKIAGQLKGNYKISVQQPIQNKKLSVKLLDFESQGKIFVDFTNADKEPPMNWQITDHISQLVIDDLQLDTLHIGNLITELSSNQTKHNQLDLNGTMTSSSIEIDGLKLAKISSVITASGMNINEFQVNINNQITQLRLTDFSVEAITSQLGVVVNNLDVLDFTGDTSFTNLSTHGIHLQPISVHHTGQARFTNMSLSSQHDVVLEQSFLARLQQQQNHINLNINQQDTVKLKNIASQLDNSLLIKEGKLSTSIDLTLPENSELFSAVGTVNIQDVSAKYQDYLVNNINYQTPLIFDSAGLQLPESSLHVQSIDVGVMIEQVQAKIISEDSLLRMEHVQGDIFKGQFSLAKLWLDDREQKFNVNFNNIDLEQVMALQQQPGLKITGKVNGNMPIAVDKEGIKIENGWLSSLTGGKLTIKNNPSFDSIKTQQPELALLENLDFTQLESKVKFDPDGWVFFDFAIQGNNPDRKQSVNFNYSHEENLFSLLESIRLVNSVENQIEQKIIQGDKK